MHKQRIRIIGIHRLIIPQSFRVLHLLMFFCVQQCQVNYVIGGMTEENPISSIPLSGDDVKPQIGSNNDNSPILQSFLDPCEILTLETQCTEEEYESNEDCLPQKTDNCDHSKELFCLSGVCLPNCHPHKENYDHITGKCFRKVGSDCRTAINGSTVARDTNSEGTSISPHPSLESNQEQILTTVIVPPCEKNAVCERGQCRCAKDFTYDHSFNKCLLFAPYSGQCNETVNCDRKSDIECRENQCQCKSPEMQYFHLKRKRCYILIGQVCSSGLQFCPDNSNCVKGKGNFTIEQNTYEPGDGDVLLRQLYQEIASNHHRTDDGEAEEHFIGILGEDEEKEFVCKCDKGYGSTRDKRYCLGLHGAWCNTLHRCNSDRGLKCYDGTCLCDREIENEQVYSEQFQTCITLVGAPCLADGRGERERDICSIGASCRNERCVCDNGLIPTALDKQTTSSIIYSCMKSNGMMCRSGNDSLDNMLEPRCNHEVGLVCDGKYGKCSCENSDQFFDQVIGKCKTFFEIEASIPVVHSSPPKNKENEFRKNCGSQFTRDLANYYVTTFSLIVITLINFVY